MEVHTKINQLISHNSAYISSKVSVKLAFTLQIFLQGELLLYYHRGSKKNNKWTFHTLFLYFAHKFDGQNPLTLAKRKQSNESFSTTYNPLLCKSHIMLSKYKIRKTRLSNKQLKYLSNKQHIMQNVSINTGYTLTDLNLWTHDKIFVKWVNCKFLKATMKFSSLNSREKFWMMKILAQFH